MSLAADNCRRIADRSAGWLAACRRGCVQLCLATARGALIAMVVAAPWMFGGVQGRAGWAFYVAAGVLVAWLVQMLIDRAAAPAAPLVLLVLFAALAMGACQLIPLGPQVAGRLAPATVRWRSELLPSATSADAWLSGAGRDGPRSAAAATLDPAATRHDLAMLLLAVVVFLAGATFFRSAWAALILLAACVLNGAALAFWEICSLILAHGDRCWRTDLPWGSGLWGPFINPNNAGGFLNLCLAGSVAWLAWIAVRQTCFVCRSAGRRRPMMPARGSRGGRATLYPGTGAV